MKTITKILSAILVCIMIIGLCACETQQPSNSSNTPEQNNSTSTDKPTGSNTTEDEKYQSIDLTDYLKYYFFFEPSGTYFLLDIDKQKLFLENSTILGTQADPNYKQIYSIIQSYKFEWNYKNGNEEYQDCETIENQKQYDIRYLTENTICEVHMVEDFSGAKYLKDQCNVVLKCDDFSFNVFDKIKELDKYEYYEKALSCRKEAVEEGDYIYVSYTIENENGTQSSKEYSYIHPWEDNYIVFRWSDSYPSSKELWLGRHDGDTVDLGKGENPAGQSTNNTCHVTIICVIDKTYYEATPKIG